MSDPDLVRAVARSLAAETRTEFDDRVDDQARSLREALSAGRFDNEAFSLGLELEAYAVDGEGRLARVPEDVFESAACNKELGLHNVELNTAPDEFTAAGVAAQADRVRELVSEARSAFAGVGLELVLDAMWTVPPAEGTREYLSAVDVADGVTVAANMRRAPRYCAIDNDVLARAGGAVDIAVPGARLSFPTMLVESMATSIQPHLQVPDVGSFPTYYNVGLRTLGPVLALATNSPFLPADLYREGEDTAEVEAAGAGYGGTPPPANIDPLGEPRALVDGTYHELRVPVFEQSVNPGPNDRKVRFPRDIDRPTDVLDRLIADRTCAPFLREWVEGDADREAYADRIWELDHKRGTYWRWLRAVVGGQAVAGVGERSLRLEYRPLPTQPTVPDLVGFQCLVAGLVHGLVVADHPVVNLPWEAARSNFYRAVEEGFDADLVWVDADGDRTSSTADLYGELFGHARRGLREQGLSSSAVEEYLAPVERRWLDERTPSRWKKRAVRERLDGGADLRAAIERMQREYVRRSRSGEPFVEWDDPEPT